MSIAAVRHPVTFLALASTLALAACGGGEQVKTFNPTKIVSFGDELSYIGTQTVQGQEVKGQKYGVNYVAKDVDLYLINDVVQTAPSDALKAEFNSGAAVSYSVTNNGQTFVKTETSSADATHTRQNKTLWACSVDARLWMQILANGYGLGYSTACPGDRDGAQTYAQVGAKTADVIAQFNARRSELSVGTLVTVWAGQNDVLEVLDAYKASPNLEAQKAQLKARGEQLGQAINGLLSTGAKVLIVSVPDLGKAPGAAGYAAVASELSQAFNNGLTGLNGVINDGTKIGLVKGFDQIKEMAELPSSYSLTNTTQGLCDTSLLKKPDGTASTSLLDCVFDLAGNANGSSTRAGASLYSHLWASDFVLAPAGQARIGSLAFTRVSNNPF